MPPPPKHSQFKKGQSGNPGGIPKIKRELRAIELFTNHDFKATITKHLEMDMPHLKEVGESQTARAIDMIIAKTMVHAVEKGEYSRIHPLIERVCGRQVDVVQETPKGPSTEHLDGMSDEELTAIAKRS